MTPRRIGRCLIWWNARLDRRRNLPAPHATALSAMEQRIQSAVNLSVRSLQVGYAKVAERLKAALTAADDHLRRNDRPEFERLVEKTGRRQERVYLGPRAHWLLMGMLSAGEAAFNTIAFGVYRETLILTLLMAMGIAVVVPLIAYKTGVALRQYEPRARKAAWAISGAIVATVTLAGINWIRVNYLQALGHKAGDDSTLSISYLLLNLSIFAAATCVTYLAKDPEPGFVEAKNQIEQWQAEIAGLRGQLNELNSKLVYDAKALHEAGHQAIAYYRGINSRGRVEVPTYFDDESVVNHRVNFVDVTPERFDQPRSSSADPILDAHEHPAAQSRNKPVVRIRGIM